MSVELARLPRRTLKAGTRLYRIHRAAREAWYFSETGLGRFDPVASPGRGAAYWAEDPLGAWVEVFRTRMLLTPTDLEMRALSTITLRDPVRVIDLTSRRALAAGVTAALSAGGDYGDSHALADALQGVGPGVRWRLRHDLRQALIGVALFGRTRPRVAADLGRLPKPTTAGVPTDLVERAGAEFGYEVLEQPR